MRWLRNTLLAVAALLVVIVGAVAVRTATFRPPAAQASVALPATVPVDGARAAARLGEAIRFRTVSHQDASADETAEWDKLHTWLQATYPAAHVAMRREVVDGRTLLYTWTGGDPALPPILLMAHQDVVPVTPGTEGAWKQPPFSGAVVDGVVWGRGAIDDKGSLVALMEAAEGLAERGFRPRRTVLFAFGHNEEVLGSGAQSVAALLTSRDVRPWFALDEGLAVVADHPVTGRPVALIGVAEKGYGTVRLTARAEGGHSSMPPPAEGNAVVTLAKAVQRVGEAPFPYAFAGPARDMLRGVAGDAPLLTRMAVANEWLFGPLLTSQIAASAGGRAMLHTTTAPTMLDGSPKENVLPQTATARVNYRLHPDDTPEEVLAHVKTALGDLPVEATWEGQPSAASPVSSSEGDAWRLLAAIATASTGAPAAPGIVVGATDAKFMAGVARDIYRFQPIVLSVEELGMIHGTNERISVENLDRMAEFYARLISAGAG